MLIRNARGFTLLEVLITVLILAFGLLGLANLQAKIHLTEMESYQRAQAVLLLQDMADRIRANRFLADTYVTGTDDVLGVDDDQPEPADCAAAASLQERDFCEWSNALKGAAEQKDAANVGAMVNARGCVEQVVAYGGSGSCQAGVYRITVVWQGLHPTAEPDLGCASGDDFDYGGDGYRRAVSKQVTIGDPSCID